MPPQGEEHNEILRLVRENSVLVKQNNELLRKMYRNDLIGIWIRVVWYIVLIGLPFALYVYVLEPYFGAFGANFEIFKQGIAEIPGLKGLEGILPSFLK